MLRGYGGEEKEREKEREEERKEEKGRHTESYLFRRTAVGEKRKRAEISLPRQEGRDWEWAELVSYRDMVLTGKANIIIIFPSFSYHKKVRR